MPAQVTRAPKSKACSHMPQCASHLVSVSSSLRRKMCGAAGETSPLSTPPLFSALGAKPPRPRPHGFGSGRPERPPQGTGQSAAAICDVSLKVSAGSTFGGMGSPTGQGVGSGDPPVLWPDPASRHCPVAQERRCLNRTAADRSEFRRDPDPDVGSSRLRVRVATDLFDCLR